MGDVIKDECDSLLKIPNQDMGSKNKQNPLEKGLVPNSQTKQLDLHGDGTMTDHEKSSQSERSWFRIFLDTEIDDITSLSLWRACAAEFLGTFLLCFYTIGVGLFMADKSPPPFLQVALGTGLFVAVLVTALAAVSGCHINPAVTVGFAVLRYVSLVRSVAYIIFQCMGAITGSLLLKDIVREDMVGNLGVILPADGVTDKQSVILEAILTSFLVFVVMAAIDKGRTDVQGSVPLIVGLTVCVNILVGGQITGACMNPARALGPAVIMGDYRKQWVYWVGPCIGGLFGALLYDKLFSAGADSLCSFDICRKCSPGSKEYQKVIKKEVKKMGVIEIETSPEEQV